MTVRDAQVTAGAATLLALLVAKGALSRAELARQSGLTQGAVTKALRPLLDDGYVRELPSDPVRARTVGRPSTPVELCAEREGVVGVKVTDRSAIGVRTNLRAEVQHTVERELPSAAVPDVVRTISQVVADLSRDASQVRRLGLAMSGDVDRTHGLVRYSPFLDWHNVALAQLVEDATGLAVTVENDVKSLACKEQLAGAGAGLRSFAVVTVGAGIGCSLVVDGMLVAGAFGVAGEIGHLVVDRDGPDCHCGARGCLEAVASTAALERALARATGGEVTGVPAAVSLAAAGNVEATRCLTDAGDAIGAGLAAVANLFGPQRIVVTGEGLEAGPLIRSAALARFRRQAFGAAGRCEVLFRPLPMQQWAAGAAAVAVQTALRLTHRSAGRSHNRSAGRSHNQSHDRPSDQSPDELHARSTRRAAGRSAAHVVPANGPEVPSVAGVPSGREEIPRTSGAKES